MLVSVHVNKKVMQYRACLCVFVRVIIWRARVGLCVNMRCMSSVLVAFTSLLFLLGLCVCFMCVACAFVFCVLLLIC